MKAAVVCFGDGGRTGESGSRHQIVLRPRPSIFARAVAVGGAAAGQEEGLGVRVGLAVAREVLEKVGEVWEGVALLPGSVGEAGDH